MIRASPRLLEKKEKEQIRKKSKEPKVASYKPVKFLNPYKSYTCGSDFYLVVEKDEQILFSPDWLKEVSYVNEVMYHPVKKQIILKLGHLQQFPIDWWKYVLERWRSFNRQDAADWADEIEAFCNSYPKKLEEIKNMLNSLYTESQMILHTVSREQKMQELLATQPVAIGKVTLDSNRIYWSEFHRSTLLNDLQGLTDTQFLEYSKKFGVLSYMPENAQSSWRASLKVFSKMCVNPKSDWNEYPERDEVIFNYSLNKFLKVKIKTIMYYRIEEGKIVCYGILCYSAGEKPEMIDQIYDVTDILPCHPCKIEEDAAKKQEMKNFLAHFYPPKTRNNHPKAITEKTDEILASKSMRSSYKGVE